MMSLMHDRYRVLQPLGSGNFTQTDLVMDLQSDRYPLGVLKGLVPQGLERGFVALANRLFGQEAQLLQEMEQHGGIPRLVDVFTENGVSYLVQEFVSGASLQDVFDQGQVWSESELVAFLKDALDILVYVHSTNVIHRDLKPAHWIRRGSDLGRGQGWVGPLVLIDFGVAQRGVPQHAEPLSCQLPALGIGTSLYMAPEQRQGWATFSSDLYALGLIAIQGVTGQLPNQLKHNDQGELTWQPMRPLSGTVTDILTRMVRYRPQDRQATAAEILKDLVQFSSQPQWSQRFTHWLHNGRTQPIASRPTILPSRTTQHQREAVALPGRSQVLLSILGEVPHTFLEGLEGAGSMQVWISDGSTQDPGRDAAQNAGLAVALQAADVYVVGLTPESVVNPALLHQLQLLNQLHQNRGTTKPRLVPIRIGLGVDAPLPDGVRQALRQVRQYLWRSPADTPRILEAIQVRSMPKAVGTPQLTSVA
jgi:serine/threonine-protein kinase